MVTGTTFIRVRYGEVDQMGFLYYGNYALYYEVARAEMIRNAGYPYSEMEKDGIVMPVVKMNSKFLKPAQYDQLIRVETIIKELHPHPFLTFHHKLQQITQSFLFFKVYSFNSNDIISLNDETVQVCIFFDRNLF